MRLLLLASFAVFLAACATASAAAPAPVASPADVFAKVGDRTITQQEVDVRAADELFKLQDQIYELRQQTAERIFIERAIAQAARRDKVSEEEWVELRLETGLRKPTEAELKALFEKAKKSLPADADFDSVKPELTTYLMREQRAARAKELFDELKKEQGYTVVMAGPPRPRKTVEAAGPSRGAGDAKISIVVFADFQCPYCARAAQTVEHVLAAYPGKIRLVYRHYPLSFHKQAPKAAEAAMCANEQGHFWEYHDLLYANQEALGVEDLKGHALQLGLDVKKFTACLDAGLMRAAVEKDQAVGEKLGVRGTPAYFINGLVLSGAQPEEEFRKIIDAELARLEVK